MQSQASSLGPRISRTERGRTRTSGPNQGSFIQEDKHCPKNTQQSTGRARGLRHQHPRTHLMDTSNSYPRITNCGTPARQYFADEQAQSAEPARVPPSARCHRRPPDRGYDRPNCNPLSSGDHRDQHHQDRAQTTRLAGDHHRPQQPAPHRRPGSDRHRQKHPRRPKHPAPGTQNVMSQGIAILRARAPSPR